MWGSARKTRASRVGGWCRGGRSARTPVRAYLLASSSRLALELGRALVGRLALASARFVLVVLVRPRVDPHVSRCEECGTPASVRIPTAEVARGRFSLDRACVVPTTVRAAVFLGQRSRLLKKCADREKQAFSEEKCESHDAAVAATHNDVAHADRETRERCPSGTFERYPSPPTRATFRFPAVPRVGVLRLQ